MTEVRGDSAQRLVIPRVSEAQAHASPPWAIPQHVLPERDVRVPLRRSVLAQGEDRFQRLLTGHSSSSPTAAGWLSPIPALPEVLPTSQPSHL